ncbi:MAG: hypothetical protein IPN86_21280 [Saprospiraceae bacterium]|nr:hypothetical protein [Saprospiraceae bacterium]
MQTSDLSCCNDLIKNSTLSERLYPNIAENTFQPTYERKEWKSMSVEYFMVIKIACNKGI